MMLMDDPRVAGEKRLSTFLQPSVLSVRCFNDDRLALNDTTKSFPKKYQVNIKGIKMNFFR